MGDHKVKCIYYKVFMMAFCISLFIHAYYKTVKNSFEIVIFCTLLFHCLECI